LGDPDLLRTPVLDQRINYFKEKLTVQTPDSINQALDYLLKKLEPAKESYRYYLSSFINEYAKSKIVGFDAVYVHLALEYYGKGKAPWIDGENLAEIVDNAKKLEPILVGKKAPDITVYQEDGTPVTLSKIESKYTVLLFWASDCGHCKKSMPEIISFYEKYKDKGVELLAVCTKHREKAKDCWEYIKDREGMEQWINANDEFHKSGFRFKYNVESTPQIFILDENKNILVKRIGSEQLDEVIQELLILEEKKVIDSMER
jgi:thiol-disulfide isomerase/thioredoxin